MEHLFHAVLITIGLTSTGYEELDRQQFDTVAECQAAKDQREYTHRVPSDYVGLVFLCEYD